MMDFLYYIYSKNVGKNDIKAKLVRRLITQTYNTITPVNYKVKRLLSKKRTLIKANENSSLIVSLTSFPERIDYVWLVIESLLNQTVKPKKIVLTLSRQQFSCESKLPIQLLNQKSRGLEILWSDDDLRSHKKYYYSMQKYPNSIIVTVDDDFFYASTMLETLLKYHKKYPNDVICHLAAKKNGLNYREWTNLFFKGVPPTTSIMQYGGSGTLYPPNVLHKDVFDKNKIHSLCPLADDIWLNCMTIINGRKIVKTNYDYYLIPILIRNKKPLSQKNVYQDFNSQQIERLNKEYDYY